MPKAQNLLRPKYDIGKRSYCFSRRTRDFILSQISPHKCNIEYSQQLIRSSSSVAANYIEANEALSKKDFFYRIKLCRKEAKESILWLHLITTKTSLAARREKNDLIREALELTKIFGSIVTKK